MDKQLAGYIKKHIIFVSTLIIVGFLVLGAGEYYLYRQQMYLNQMVSEGFMMVNTKQDKVLDRENSMTQDKDSSTQDNDSTMEEVRDKIMNDGEGMMGQ